MTAFVVSASLPAAQLVHLHGPWRTRAQLEYATMEWIDWYNATRLHGGNGSFGRFR